MATRHGPVSSRLAARVNTTCLCCLSSVTVMDERNSFASSLFHCAMQVIPMALVYKAPSSESCFNVLSAVTSRK